MTIAFITTQSLTGSTVAGRILPLASQLCRKATIFLYIHGEATPIEGITCRTIGDEPFIVTEAGKTRIKGIALLVHQLGNIIRTTKALIKDKPDTIVIVKPLPQNTAAVWLATFFYKPKHMILDCDDFELTANVLTSIIQRAAIHTSERLAGRLVGRVIAATPFLQDHARYLYGDKMPIILVPTGIGKAPVPTQDEPANVVYAGSISISSGHRVDLIIEIAKLVKTSQPNLTFHIAGSGHDVGKLKQDAVTAGVAEHIVWHGRFTTSTLEKILTKKTILLDPIDSSIVARAKSSYRCMLALKTGLPIVTSNVGIRTQIIPTPLHERFFAEPGSAQSYADNIKALLQHPLSDNDINLLKEAGRQYSWEVLAPVYMPEMMI